MKVTRALSLPLIASLLFSTTPQQAQDVSPGELVLAGTFLTTASLAIAAGVAGAMHKRLSDDPHPKNAFYHQKTPLKKAMTIYSELLKDANHIDTIPSTPWVALNSPPILLIAGLQCFDEALFDSETKLMRSCIYFSLLAALAIKAKQLYRHNKPYARKAPKSATAAFNTKFTKPIAWTGLYFGIGTLSSLWFTLNPLQHVSILREG